jgi:hypothetical protein
VAALWGFVGMALVVAVVACGVWLVAGEPKTKKVTVKNISDAEVALYRRAARLLNRLINITDLEGDLSGDIMSWETRQDIEAWLADYKKELNKNAN